MLIQSFTETRNVQKQEVKNNSGEVVGLSLFNPTDSLSWSGVITGTYSTTAGATLASVANSTGTTGRIVVDSVAFNKSTDGFVSVNVSATRYPNMS